MANPQTENGYTRVANEIMDALCRVTLTSSERQVLDVIFRKTYGYNKKKDAISISQFMSATGLARRTVIYALKNVEAKKMIQIDRAYSNSKNVNETNKISFQKNHTLWVVQGTALNYRQALEKQRERYHKGVVQGERGSARNGKRVVQGTVSDIQFLAPTKDSITKDSITKDRARSKIELKIPDFVNKSLWQDFLSMRKEKKKPATERAQKIILDKLAQFKEQGYDVEAILSASIVNCWTDIYLPKEKPDINKNQCVLCKALPATPDKPGWKSLTDTSKGAVCNDCLKT